MNSQSQLMKEKQAGELIHAQHELGVKLGSASRLKEGLRLCLETALEISGMDCGGIYLFDEPSGDLNLCYHQGLPASFVKSAAHFEAPSANANLVRTGDPIYTQHQKMKLPLTKNRKKENLRAIAVIPFSHRSRVIGCMNLASYSKEEVPPGAREALETIAAQIGSAVARLRAEEALRESEEKFKAIFENASDGLIYIDHRGHILHLNEKAASIYGGSREELEGKHFSRIGLFSLKEILNLLKGFGHAITQKPFAMNLAITNKKGRELHLECSTAVVEKENSKGLIVIVRDVTDQFKAAEERQKLEAQLQQAQKMEAIGTLAGGIAHDFNNLLMGIQGRTSLMLFNTDMNHPFYSHLKGIESYIKSAVDLTSQLLDFARSTKYETEPTDLNALIKNHNRLFGRTKKEITIHGSYTENPWLVEANRGQIEQVLLNLYVNAWHAMPVGGDIFVNTANVLIDENLGKIYNTTPGRYARITVTDKGIGMDEATQRRIFEPFFTTKKKGQGTGLGLATVYAIIRNHGGFINVYSEPGKGSTFYIFLPASTKIPTPVHDEKSLVEDEILTGSGTVLLVDDEDIIIEVSCDMLESLGYRVLKAHSGQQAVEIFRANRESIDLVLLDLIMPDMNGAKTFKQLKELDPSVKVLICSGYSMNEQVVQIMDQGGAGFIQKPFDVQELSHKLKEILHA